MKQKNLTVVARHVKQFGFALQEVALALLILLIVGIVALTWFSNSRDDAKVLEEINTLPKISANIQALYHSRPNFNGVTLDSLVKNGVFPESYGARTGSTAQNQFGGQITVAVATCGGLTDGCVTLTYPNVPTAACNGIVPKVTSSFRNIVVGGASVYAGAEPTIGQFDPAKVGPACAASDPVQIVYWVKK